MAKNNKPLTYIGRMKDHLELIMSGFTYTTLHRRSWGKAHESIEIVEHQKKSYEVRNTI